MVLALEICKQLWEKRDTILVQTFLRLGLLPKLTWIAEDCESFINMLDSGVKKKVSGKFSVLVTSFGYNRNILSSPLLSHRFYELFVTYMYPKSATLTYPNLHMPSTIHELAGNL